MNIEQAIKDLDVLSQQQNKAIAEFTQRATIYARALQQGEISQEEYQSLMGDITQIKAMANSADEEKTVVRIFQIAKLIPSLV